MRVVCLIILVGVIRITELFTIQDNNVTEHTTHQNISGNSNFTFNDTHINKNEVVKIKESAKEELTNRTVQEEYSSPGNDSLKNVVKSGNQTDGETEEDDDEADYVDRLGCDCVKTLSGGVVVG